MKIDIYQSTVNSGAFLSVPAGTDLNNISVTEVEIGTFGNVNEYKKSLSINAGDNRVALNSEKVIGEIENKGYAIHGTKLQFNEHIESDT